MTNSSKDIKHLISESSLEEAAQSLAQHWQDKDASMYNLTVQLQERFHALKKEIATGVISRTDAELERAKITDALLYLTDRLENPDMEVPRHLQRYLNVDEKKANRTWLLVVAGVVLLMVVGYFSMQATLKPTDFDLKVFLHGPGGLAEPIINAQVKLAFGDYQLPPREVDAQGRVDFTDIPIKYADDSIRLILMDLTYEVVRQSAPTAAQSNDGSITFELKPVVQWTNWRGTLKNANGKPVANARLDIESGLASATTNEDGNFEVKVPRASGERVQVIAYVNGKQVLNNSFVLTEQVPTQIQINKQQ